MAVAISVVLAAGLVFVWVRVVQTLTEPAPAPRAIGEPGALVWDGRVFTSPSQLKAYLGPKRYTRWTVRHPTAFGATAPATVSHTAATKKKPAKPQVAAPPTVATAESRSLTSRVLTIFLVLGGLALATSALLPERLAPVAMQRLYAEPDRRIIALAAATAMLLGFGVSYLFG